MNIEERNAIYIMIIFFTLVGIAAYFFHKNTYKKGYADGYQEGFTHGINNEMKIYQNSLDKHSLDWQIDK